MVISENIVYASAVFGSAMLFPAVAPSLLFSGPGASYTYMTNHPHGLVEGPPPRPNYVYPFIISVYKKSQYKLELEFIVIPSLPVKIYGL